MPGLLLAVLLTVQVGLWQHAKHVALAAAQEGARAARQYNATAAAGRRRAEDYLTALAPALLRAHTVVVERSATTATVRVHGQVTTVLPWPALAVDETSSGPVERFIPEVRRSADADRPPKPGPQAGWLLIASGALCGRRLRRHARSSHVDHDDPGGNAHDACSHPTSSTVARASTAGRTLSTRADRSRPAERGTAAVEFVLLTPLLAAVLLFLAVLGRMAEARGQVQGAARDAARAASLQRSLRDATSAAQEAARASLDGQHITCAAFTVAVDVSGYRPGGQVGATVRCTTTLARLGFVGFPATRAFTATAVAPIESWRGR